MGGWKRWAALAGAPVLGIVGLGLPVVALAQPASAAPNASHQGSTSAPATPFIETVVPEGLGVLVNWNPNATTDQVTGYTVTPAVAVGFTGKIKASCEAPASTSVPAADTSALVSPLCAGLPYTFTMTATNAAGTSAPSPSSDVATPLAAQAPDAPLILSVLPRNGSLIVSWAAPSLTGGDRLKGYTLTLSGVTKPIKPKAAALQATVKGLTDGTDYSITLVANSKAGSSAPSSSSGTPQATYAPVAPESLQVVPDGNGNLVASWTAPSDDGGATITEYQVTTQEMTPDGSGGWTTTGDPVNTSAPGSASTSTLTGLTTDAYYSVSVAGVNTAGTGVPATTDSPVTPSFGLSSSTVVLSTATMDSLASDASGILTWPSPAPAQVQGLVAGNVIIAGVAPVTPEGLLASVDSVTTDGSGDVTVATSAATLDQAFTNLGVSESGNPLAIANSTFQATSAGVRSLKRAKDLGVNADVTLSLSHTDGAFSVSGALDLRAKVDLSLGLNTGFLDIPDGVHVSSSATVSAVAHLTASVSGSASWEIGDIRLDCFDIQVGPVPVVLCPTIPVDLNATGSISLSADASVTVGAAMSWTSADPTALDAHNLTTSPVLGGGPQPGVSTTATGALALEAKPQIDIYGVTGPEVTATAQLTASVNFAGSPYFSLQPSVSVGVGWSINFLSYQADVTLTLATLDFPAFEITSAPNADLSVSPVDPTVAPGVPTTFQATRSDGASHPITWSLRGEVTGDAITSDGVLTVAAPGDRTLTVLATDSTGAVGETTVTVGSAFDPPGDLQVTLVDPTDASVTWQAPEETGGSALAGYTLVTQPATTFQQLPATATSATLSGLTAGTNYVVSLYATNVEGATSLPATESTSPLDQDSDQPSGISGVTSLASDGAGYCAILGSGQVDCWGENTTGALGNGTTTPSDAATTVVGVGGLGTLSGVVALDGDIYDGNQYNGGGYCALLDSGQVDCWGINTWGALGNGSYGGNSAVPTQVVGVGGTGVLSGVVSLASDGASYGTSAGYCAVLSSGQVDCWGYNDGGALGNDSSAYESAVPTQVVGVDGVGLLTGVTSLTSGGGGFEGGGYCALLGSGQVDCWGVNTFGALGSGTDETGSDVPTQVAGVGGSGILSGVGSLATNDTGVGYCALLVSSEVDCWGDNEGGELGSGSTASDSPVPTQVAAVGGTGVLTGVASLTAGILGGNYCALLTSGQVDCWGVESEGSLGNGIVGDPTVLTYSAEPTQVLGLGGTGVLSGVASIASNSMSGGFCAVLDTGQVDCWGDDRVGELGDGTIMTSLPYGSPVPVQVVGLGGTGLLAGVASITSNQSGGQGYCALAITGQVNCWGANYESELANETAANPGVPIPVVN
jgi:alpha-tubulin suppressor-like RCC1 family protein